MWPSLPLYRLHPLRTLMPWLGLGVGGMEMNALEQSPLSTRIRQMAAETLLQESP